MLDLRNHLEVQNYREDLARVANPPRFGRVLGRSPGTFPAEDEGGEEPPSSAHGGKPKRVEHKAPVLREVDIWAVPDVELVEETKGQQRRGVLYTFRDELRPYQSKRQAGCGRLRIKGCVELHLAEGRAFYKGILACGSVWTCPTCSAKIRSERAEEVKKVIEWHGPSRTYLLTLTVRHGVGHDLGVVRRGVARAFRRCLQGRRWKKFQEQWGCVGSIRALEITVGPNGWHPHIHCLLLLGQRFSEGEVEKIQFWFARRWRDAVEKELGKMHVPDHTHGCDLRLCRKADYLAKLGLELLGFDKVAIGDSRTPWQVAKHLVDTGEGAAIWDAYRAGIKGAKMLTWSKGLREQAGLGAEKKDEELASEEEKEAEQVATIAGGLWDRIARVRGGTARVLSAAERGGLVGVKAELGVLFKEDAVQAQRARDG